MRERRLADIKAERQRWAERIRRAEQHIGELKERLSALDIEIAGVPDDPTVFADRRRVLAGEVGTAESALAAALSALSEAEAQHQDALEGARAASDRSSEVRESRAREEERVIAAAQRKTELAAQIAEHFDCPLDELRALSEIEEGAELPEASAAETRLHKLKAERERLGGVNLRAEEETQELETRLGEMRSENEDLEEAIKRLRQGIQNLNREGRQRLLAAFETVNGHFVSLFKHLFGGGTAELSLVGSEDPLEAGLEIVARPPGKRPQVMTLLSGGEQALTALALIFAVFLTNPSPICVLDEVDAPLDDANVERFCALLDDMRHRTDTRFVVVTHNPITMAKMDRLYGVTMAERGVSQVVSVDLAQAERYREAS
jgi:chromosome segregation protein